MEHLAKITVVNRPYFKEIADSFGYGIREPCDFYADGQEFLVDERSYATMLDGRFCGEAWDCIKRYVFTALHGGTMIGGDSYVACCNDASRPVAFRIDRIDVPEDGEGGGR